MATKKRLLLIMLIFMSFSFNISARNPKVGVLDVFIKDKNYLSKKMSEFIKDELKTKNRIDFLELQEGNQKFKNNNFKKNPRKINNNELLSKVSKLTKEKEYKMASELLNEVIKNYEDNFEHIDNFYSLYKAYLDRAFLKNLENLDKESKKDLKQAISIGRNYDFDPKDYSPRFLIKYKRERKRGKKKKASININGKGVLYLDGIKMGNLPIKVSNISYGKHYLFVIDAGVIIKKDIISLNKKKKYLNINLNNKAFSIDSIEKAVNIIENKLKNKNIDEILKLALRYLSSKNSVDYLLFGISDKENLNYITELFLYNPFKNKIIKATTAKFDEDLLTADVESLRIAKIVVSNVDNFDLLTEIIIKKESMKNVSYPAYKKLEYKKREKKIVKKETIENIEKKNEDKLALVDKNNSENKNNVILDEDLDDKDIKLSNDIKLDDADYSILKEKNKEKFKEKDSGSVFTSWWFWTSVAIVTVASAGITTYFILDSRTNSVTPQVSW